MEIQDTVSGIVANATEQIISSQMETGEHNEQLEYTIIEVICYPFYMTLLFTLCVMISFNKRKFKRRHRIDEIFLFCGVYLFNVVITWNFFEFIPKLGRFIITLIVIFGVQHYVGRFQIIGITGGIGCGKSTISKFFSGYLQLNLIDCDLLSRQIVEPGKPAYNQIVERFGKEVLDKNSNETLPPINRKVLGEIVFNSKVKRQLLTSITNKYIFLAILKDIWRHCFRSKDQYIVLDAPLLFESKILPYLCFPIITVYITDEDEQVKRVVNRDGLPEEQVRQRIKAQMPTAEKIPLSDIVLNNDKDEKHLIKQLQNKVFDYLL